MGKSNGKWVVVVILAIVFGLSLLAWVVQQNIDAKRGQPVEAAEESQ